MRLISRLRAQFGVELPIRALFEAPTVAELAAQVAGQQRAGLGLERPMLTPQARPERLPLSYAQERLWVLEQFGLPGGAYTILGGVRLEGELDMRALAATFLAIAARHESLRTRFGSEDGVPYQVIEAAVPGLEHEDLSALPAAERSVALAGAVRALAAAPFDLQTGPLWRVRLFRLDAQEHAVLLAMHHIISDGWSMGVLIEEIGRFYGGYASGAPVSVGRLPVQYADYALWQRAWLQGAVLQRQRDYWHAALADAPAALELPLDHARPAQQSFRGAHLPVVLPAELSAALQQLARREGATLFMVLLASYQLLLSRWSGQDDVVVGTPIANRTQAESEGLVGFFVNTLALRARIDGRESFASFLGRVREGTLGAYAHQDLPFEQVVELLQPTRDLSRQPVFQAMFALQNTPREALQLPGLRLSRLEGELSTAKFDVTLVLTETPAGLRGTLEYATDLFGEATMQRLLGHYQLLLAALVADPQQAVGSLPLLSAAEREQVLRQWNATRPEIPDSTLVDLIEWQVDIADDTVAVVYEQSTLTYRELNERANRLAHLLRAAGVGPERIVGICMERSLDLVVGLLGILKAGGAYLPLDPDYPAERLQLMVDDAAPLACSAPALRCRAAGGQVVLDLGEARTQAQLAAQPCNNPDRRQVGLTSQHPAYVIYTSGSTGRPKGVVIQHANAVNFLCWGRGFFTTQDLRCVLFSTSLNFDLAVYECWAPLISGTHRANRAVMRWTPPTFLQA